MNEQNTQSPAGYEKNNYAWFILAINALAFGLTVGPMMQTGQFIPHMVKDFNASTGEVSLMMSLMALGGMVATPVAGQVFQKVPFKPYYAACMAVLTLSRAAFGISTALWQIWALSFIGGVASGLSIQIVSPIIVGNWFKEKGGTALGLSVSASAIGGAVMGPPVAAMIASLGWRRSALLLYSVTGAIVVALVLLFLVRSPAEKGMRPYGFRPEVPGQQTPLIEGVPARVALRSPAFIRRRRCLP